ncbi:MAG: hypothetical protein K2P33_05680, partial [Acutalibacter sp.]|nr:hypothetical protein [Acutalibacter sp.]
RIFDAGDGCFWVKRRRFRFIKQALTWRLVKKIYRPLTGKLRERSEKFVHPFNGGRVLRGQEAAGGHSIGINC